jgi:hypothetical protein
VNLGVTYVCWREDDGFGREDKPLIKNYVKNTMWELDSRNLSEIVI